MDPVRLVEDLKALRREYAAATVERREAQRKLLASEEARVRLIKENEELKRELGEGRKQDAQFLEATLRTRITVLERELQAAKVAEIPVDSRNKLKEWQLNEVRKLEVPDPDLPTCVL